MFRSISVLFAVLLLTAAVAPRAGAQIVDEEGVGKLTIGGMIGMGLTSMSDINQNLDVANVFLAREEVRSMDKIRSGILTGLDIRYKFAQTPREPDSDEEDSPSFIDRLAIGLTWGAVNTKSGFDVSRATTRFYARSTTFYPYLLYHLPWIEEKLERTTLYVGGGPLFLTGGSIEWALGDSTTNNFIDEGDLSEIAGQTRADGSGVGLVLQGGSSFMLNSTFSVALDAGYRFAKMDVNLQEAEGQVKRFTGEDDDGNTIVRRPGDWSVIDFYERRLDGEYDGRKREDPKDDGGCADCPLYYQGGPIEVDFSGFFAVLAFRVHFF
jgi:hypothetical protein